MDMIPLFEVIVNGKIDLDDEKERMKMSMTIDALASLHKTLDAVFTCDNSSIYFNRDILENTEESDGIFHKQSILYRKIRES